MLKPSHRVGQAGKCTKLNKCLSIRSLVEGPLCTVVMLRKHHCFSHDLINANPQDKSNTVCTLERYLSSCELGGGKMK